MLGTRFSAILPVIWDPGEPGRVEFARHQPAQKPSALSSCWSSSRAYRNGHFFRPPATSPSVRQSSINRVKILLSHIPSSAENELFRLIHLGNFHLR